MSDRETTLSAEQLLEHGKTLRHLVRALVDDEHAVDDIVQDSYLATLHSRLPRGRLGAWMRGVARNLSFRHVRDARRRREREGAAGRRDAPEPPSDTDEHALLLSRIAEEVQRLREPFRTAIVMRYWQDLPPRRISAALGVPLDTVRSRLRTGLADLRGRLDRHHGGRAAWVGPLLGLAGGRSTVPTAFGVKSAWSCAACLFVLAIGGVLFEATGWGGVDQGSGPGGSTDRRDPAEAAPETGTPGATRSALATPPRPGPELRVTGRCIDGRSGAPLSGVIARLERVFAGGEWRLAETWHDPEPVPSGGDGRFAIELPADAGGTTGTFRLSLEAQPVRIQETGLDRLRLGEDGRLDVGDVRLFGTVLVRGRITDRHGQPLGGMRVLFHRVQLNPVSTQERGVALADADGRFRIHLEQGSWSVDTGTLIYATIDSALSNRVSPAAVDLTGSADSVELTLVSQSIGPQHRISGAVVDTEGRPVAGVEVEFVRPDDRQHPEGHGRTDARGAFTAYVWKEWPGADEAQGVRARVARLDEMEQEHELPLDRPEALYGWGSEVRIVVRRAPSDGPTIAVRVAGEDTVVEDYGIAVGKGRLPRPRSAVHPHGIGSVRGTAGSLFRVYPDDPDLLPSLPSPVPSTTEETTRTVEVYRRGTLAVRVVDSSGAPVQDCRLSLVHTVGSLEDPSWPLREDLPDAAAVAAGTVAASRRGHILGTIHTDPQGQASLEGPRGAEGLTLVAAHPRFATTVRTRQEIRTDARVEVALRRGGTLRGTVRPIQHLRALRTAGDTRRALRLQGDDDPYPGIVLTREDGDRFPRGFTGRRAVPVAADGSFVVWGVPPGTWKVSIAYRPANEVRRGVTLGPHAATSPLGEIPLAVIEDLQAGEERRLDLTIEHVPAHLSGQALADGRPVGLQRIYFFRIGSPDLGEASNPSTVTDAHGRFSMPHLEPGEYAIWRKHRGVWNGVPWYLSWVPFTEHVELVAGQRVVQDFHSRFGALLVRFRQPDGTPLADTWVDFISIQRHRWAEDERTDDAGSIRFPSFPCGEIEFRDGRGTWQFEPPRIRLEGTGAFETFDVVARPRAR